VQDIGRQVEWVVVGLNLRGVYRTVRVAFEMMLVVVDLNLRGAYRISPFDSAVGFAQ